MTLITSPANPRVSKLKSLHTARGRKQSGLFFMEGPHLLIALLNAAIVPQEIYYQPQLLSRTADGRFLLTRLLALTTSQRGAAELVEVSERVIEALGEVQTSQGVISVLPLAAFSLARLRAQRPRRKRPALLVLDNLADPGNMGTVLRTALAADVDGVLLAPNCVDCYSSKVVRSAAGAHIGLPIEVDLSWAAIAERAMVHCGGTSRVLLAEAESEHIYWEQDLTLPFVLIIGNEAHGPSQEARVLATQFISIPLANSVESLNAAMAAGIVLYEAVRQLRLREP